MTDLLRQEIAATATPIVVKVGTPSLNCYYGQLTKNGSLQLAEQLHATLTHGRQVVLVSSVRWERAWDAWD